MEFQGSEATNSIELKTSTEQVNVLSLLYAYQTANVDALMKS
jgi:hypothetical protein